jgi:DNA-binding NarL/FixJ family response regulator
MPATILIVINHHALREALRKWLELKFPQYPILEASSGENALVTARTSLPHLVITSIGLWQTSGLTSACQIRAVVPEAWIVILTTCEDAAHQAETSPIGANICIPMQALPPLELQTTLALLLAHQDEPIARKPKRFFNRADFQPVELSCSTSVTI